MGESTPRTFCRKRIRVFRRAVIATRDVLIRSGEPSTVPDGHRYADTSPRTSICGTLWGELRIEHPRGTCVTGPSYFDLHVHSTDASDDAGGTVEGYCKWIESRRKAGYQIDGFVLTEHRRYLGEVDYSVLAAQYGVTILRGIEVETDVGHVLVYGVSAGFLQHFE